MKIKNLFFGMALAAGAVLTATSCGCGSQCDVDSDTVVSTQLSDSMSRAFGAFFGADSQSEVGNMENVDEYIEGFQLIAGHKFSREQLMGIRQGLFMSEQFAWMEAQGVPVNRDLFLQEFRRVINNPAISQEEFSRLYTDFQTVMQQVEAIMMKREEMRNNAAAAEAEEETPDPSANVAETEEIEEYLNIDVSDNDDNGKIDEEVGRQLL